MIQTEGLILDQAECILFKSVSMASRNREQNRSLDSQVSENPLDSQPTQMNHVCWLKMKLELLKSDFKMKELGNPKHMLKVRVEFLSNGISVSQHQYIQRIVHTVSFHKGDKAYVLMKPQLTSRKILDCESEKFDPHCTANS
jgi:hypothetical protein